MSNKYEERRNKNETIQRERYCTRKEGIIKNENIAQGFRKSRTAQEARDGLRKERKDGRKEDCLLEEVRGLPT